MWRKEKRPSCTLVYTQAGLEKGREGIVQVKVGSELQRDLVAVVTPKVADFEPKRGECRSL